MTLFSYRAVSVSGAMENGTVEAPDRQQVMQRLLAKNLRPVQVWECGASAHKKTVFKGRGSDIALQFLTKLEQLHVGGLQLGDAVHVMRQRMAHAGLKHLAQALWNDISEGSSLATAMRKFPDIFDEATACAIEAGEATGNLAPILRDLIERMRSRAELKKQLLAGLSYPVFVCGVAFAVVCLFLFWLLPRIQTMMHSLGGKMTLPARILIGAATAVIKFGPFVLIGAVLFGVWIWRQRKTEAGRLWVDARLLRLPMLGVIFYYGEIARAANILATLTNSGVNATDAMRLTEKTIQNTWLKAQFQEARVKINDGTSFARAFQQHPFMPDIARDILAVSENTGDLGKSFAEIAKIYQNELTQKLQWMSKVVTGVALAGAFTLVSLLALGIVTSVLQVSNSVLKAR